MAAVVEEKTITAPAEPENEEEQSADNMEEEFDVVDEANIPISKASRRTCHEKGLLHRSTHIFLFRSHTKVGQMQPCVEVLLQQRSAKKKAGPGQWDVSVAEHLSAGEDYMEAAIRGLSEELAVKMSSDSLVTVRQPYLSMQTYEEAGVMDNMFTSTFAALYDERMHGRIQINEAEVQATEWWSVDKLVLDVKQDPSKFTRWFLIELQSINVEELGRSLVGAM